MTLEKVFKFYILNFILLSVGILSIDTTVRFESFDDMFANDENKNGIIGNNFKHALEHEKNITDALSNKPFPVKKQNTSTIKTVEVTSDKTEDESMVILNRSTLIVVVVGFLFLSVMGIVLYRKSHQKSRRNYDDDMIRSLLETEMDYAAM